jgi:hypothetical protein
MVINRRPARLGRRSIIDVGAGASPPSSEVSA